MQCTSDCRGFAGQRDHCALASRRPLLVAFRCVFLAVPNGKSAFIPITLEELKAKICIETVNNADQYISFFLSPDEQSLFKGLDMYLIDRHYDQSFGDLVPAIIENALNLTLHILNENDQNRTVNAINVTPRSGESTMLSLHRCGDHYNGVRLDSPELASPEVPEPTTANKIHVAHSTACVDVITVFPHDDVTNSVTAVVYCSGNVKTHTHMYCICAWVCDEALVSCLETYGAP